jgi:hypothetical protein
VGTSVKRDHCFELFSFGIDRTCPDFCHSIITFSPPFPSTHSRVHATQHSGQQNLLSGSQGTLRAARMYARR